MSSPSNALNISNPGLVYFDGSYSFDGRVPISSNNTVTITVNPTTIDFVASASGDVQTLTGNSGVATPIGGTINVITSNSTVKFAGVSGTLTQDFGLSNLLIGVAGTSITSGTFNVGLGQFALNSVTSGSENTCAGEGAGLSITSGNTNCLYGSGAGDAITTSSKNVGIGQGSLGLLTTALTSSVAIGFDALGKVLTGGNNVAIGQSAGTNYTGTESNNILISNTGTIGESNITRIGSIQTDCYLSGILHTTSGRTVKVTTPGAYPYTALTTDYLILIDTASARTVNLMATPATGTTIVIKDNVGSAGANNITVTPAAGNIDGSASYVMSTNYQSITLVYNAVQWNII